VGEPVECGREVDKGLNPGSGERRGPQPVVLHGGSWRVSRPRLLGPAQEGNMSGAGKSDKRGYQA
jgi:hypothetical protein